MIITKTRKYEKYVIDLNIKSQKKDFVINEITTAQGLIKQLKMAFNIISIYENIGHNKNFNLLYLSSDNILNTSTIYFVNKLFLPERTLRRYRNKYSKIIDYILDLNQIHI